MKYLSVAEYATLKKVSQQSVYGRIKRGSLKVIKEKIERIRIPVEDAELVKGD